MNIKQLIEFQAEHKAWDGKQLRDDGALGPRTEYALSVADMPLFRRNIYDQLMHCHGQREPNGDNRSSWIDARVRRAGGTPGEPWCAANVYCVLQDAGVDCLRTMSSVACLHQFPLVSDPEPMDLGGWENGDGTGHVFFVGGYWYPEVNVQGVVTFEANHDNKFMLCRRTMEGLQFRRVVAPSYAANILDASIPIVTRTVQSTR